MTEILKWLSANPEATRLLVGAIAIVVSLVVVIYLVAFIQGREISFWPPRIGLKPDQEKRLYKTVPQKALVREAKTDILHIRDHHGLWRPVSDEDTANYLKRVFGYQEDEDIETASVALEPLGDEVLYLRNWKRPLTKAEKLSFDAQSSTQLLKKYVRTSSGTRILSFAIRNNSKDELEVRLAELVLDVDAPLTARDIAARNNPKNVGLLTCRLLFSGESEYKKIPPQGEAQLDLFLQRQFTPIEITAVTSIRLGYIRVQGVYCKSEIMFHLYV